MAAEHLGEMAAVATAVLWTLSTLAWTSAGKHVGAMSVSVLRLGMAIAMLAAYGGIVRGLPLPTDADGRTWLLLGISGVLGFLVADLCLFKAFLMIGPRLSLLVLSLSPPMAAMTSWVFLSEGLSARQWTAMAVTLGGILWVVLEQPNGQRLPHEKRQLGLGVLLAVVAAAGQAGGLVLSHKGIGNYDAAAATMIRILGAVPCYVVLLTVLGRWRHLATAARHGRAMVILAFGTVVGPFVGVILCMVALRHCHPGIVATIIGTTPVLILPFTIFVYHERVSPRAACGAVVSVAGVAMLML